MCTHPGYAYTGGHVHVHTMYIWAGNSCTQFDLGYLVSLPSCEYYTDIVVLPHKSALMLWVT